MKRLCAHFAALLIAAMALPVLGQSAKRVPHIGYVYPGGGQRGTTFTVLVGGQYLRPMTDVDVTGKGIDAKVLQFGRMDMPLNKDRREAILALLGPLTEQLWTELHKQGRVTQPKPPWIRFAKERKNADGNPPPGKNLATGKKGDSPKADRMNALPQHPLLHDLESKDLWELAHLHNSLFADFRKRQKNAQIGEGLLLEVTIGPDAEPGNREIRLRGRSGMTNQVVFQVGTLNEVRETEPNDPEQFRALPSPAPLELPVIINGQILPGDVDRFTVKARKGQQLVLNTQARSLIPFLADAVPGWFQATLAIFDARGRELAFADDFRFHPDPVLLFDVPETGTYQIEIRDSIYRGREDFVYRVSISEQPFITALFPLGGREGTKTVATVSGWNLPARKLTLDTDPGGPRIRREILIPGTVPTNPLVYAIDTLPEKLESEPNDSCRHPQRVTPPCIVNGRIGTAGDTDVYRFRGRRGDPVVIELAARRLHSPIDSLVRLLDSKGKVLAWNDDDVDKVGHLHRDMGCLTHHADSYLRATLPRDGIYHIQISDVQGHGGTSYAYRVRISPPRPDFILYTAPSSIGMRAGTTMPVSIHILRNDGFDGPVELALANAPEDFVLSGTVIPAGADQVRATLTSTGTAAGPIGLQIEGRARINGQSVRHLGTPCDDVMQAFLWRHLAPSQQMAVAVTGKGRMMFKPADTKLVRIAAGGTRRVSVETTTVRWIKTFDMKLVDPPPGLALSDVVKTAKGLTFTLSADPKLASPGQSGNLIVEVFREATWGRKNAKGKRTTRMVSAGVLPAIPYEITAN